MFNYRWDNGQSSAFLLPHWKWNAKLCACLMGMQPTTELHLPTLSFPVTFIYFVCVCIHVCHGTCVEVKRQFAEVGSFPLLCEFQAPNLGFQACWQVPLPWSFLLGSSLSLSRMKTIRPREPWTLSDCKLARGLELKLPHWPNQPTENGSEATKGLWHILWGYLWGYLWVQGDNSNAQNKPCRQCLPRTDLCPECSSPSVT